MILAAPPQSVRLQLNLERSRAIATKARKCEFQTWRMAEEAQRGSNHFERHIHVAADRLGVGAGLVRLLHDRFGNIARDAG
jgi:hypothetical protein